MWPTELSAGSIALAFAISGLVSVFVGIYPVHEMPFPEATEALPVERKPGPARIVTAAHQNASESESTWLPRAGKDI